MDTLIERGTSILVVEFDGSVIERIAVVDDGETVLITTKERFINAEIAGQEPVSIGFPKAAITVIPK